MRGSLYNSINDSKPSRKIQSLQALRGIAFLGIFLFHANTSVGWAGLGVSIFFVMSGFLLMLHYGERGGQMTLKDSIFFSLKRIKKLYPLHIVTMSLTIPYWLFKIYHLNGFSADAIKYFLLGLVSNLLLIQTWIPDVQINASFNGVAWYLSVTMFLYFCFLFIRKFISKKGAMSLLVLCVSILLIQIVAAMIFKTSFDDGYSWFTYFFPLFRLGDFIIGCCLGKIYMTMRHVEMERIKVTALEAIVIAGSIIGVLYNPSDTTSFAAAVFNPATKNIVCASALVMLFTYKNGYVTTFATNKLTVFLGDISAQAFLIHYVITMYFNAGVKYYGMSLGLPLFISLVIVELLLSIGISYYVNRKGIFLLR